jgi:hypothetical protein
VGGPAEGHAHERADQREIGEGGTVELVTRDSTAVSVEIDKDI